MKNKIYYSKHYDMYIRGVEHNSIHYCDGCVFFDGAWCQLKTNDPLYEMCIYDGHDNKFIQVKL